MIYDINKNVREIYNKIQISAEYFLNFNVINSYKKILEFSYDSVDLGYKNILIDGGFYNLGYLYRLQLIRAALNSQKKNENAFIWDCNQFICKKILNSLNIRNIFYLNKHFLKENFSQAEKIFKQIKTKEALIDYVFPSNVPGLFLYDVIMKGQKSATVDFNDKSVKKYIFKFLCAIKFSEMLINSIKPDIIILSHAISYQCAPLAWLGAKNKIPVIVLSGGYGIPRLWRLSKSNDIFFGIGHPTKKDLNELTEKKVQELSKIGNKYLRQRISGLKKDFSGKFAFQNKQAKLDIISKKNKTQKVVAVYLGNWFDFPHIFGKTRFLDILDWITQTIEIASKNKNILWLIKPHPLDQWYGGLTLKDIYKVKLPSNVIILSNKYSGKAIIEKADALITQKSTSALEFAFLGKPVLISDKGWYHNCGFTKLPKSKQDYLDLLTKDWFKNIDKNNTARNAKLFAGLYFGIPYWQKGGILPDDPLRKNLRESLPKFVKINSKIIKKEIKHIQDWLNSGTIDYHSYKMKCSSKYSTLI